MATRLDDVQNMSKKKIMVNSLLGGLLWGAGSAIGATIIIAILGFVVSRIDVVPIIGNYIGQINSYVEEQQESSPIPFPEENK